MLLTRWLQVLSVRILSRRKRAAAKSRRGIQRTASRSSQWIANRAESLESRVTPAITGLLSGGTLTLTGDIDANTLSISVVADQYTLTSTTDVISITDNDSTGTLANDGTMSVQIGLHRPTSLRSWLTCKMAATR